jgi:hypothetical protein
LLVVFLEASYLEFPTERFLVTYTRETLINKWDAQGTGRGEGVLSLGWERGRELVENRDNCRRIPVGCEFYEL